MTRLLHASGVPLDALGRRRVARLPEAEHAQVWRLLCAHWDVFRGTPSTLLAGEPSWPSIFERLRAAVRGDGRRDLRPARGAARATDDYRPRALFERFRHRGAGHDRRSHATTCRAHAALAADPAFDRPGHPDLPPGPLPGAGPARLGASAIGPARRGRRRRHRATTPASVRGAGGSGAGTSSPTARVSADHSHVDVAHRPAGAGRGGPDLPRRRCAGEATERGVGRAPPAHAAGDGPHVLRRRAGHDPAPGRPPRPPRADAPRRSAPDTGNDIPMPGRVHRRAAPAAGALRHPPEPPPGGVHHRRDGRSRGSSPRWPASTRRCMSVRRGGSSTPPMRSGGSAPPSPRPPASPGPPGSSTTPARSARSRPATTCPAGSTPAASPGWWPSTGSTRTRPSRPALDLVTDRPTRGVQAVSRLEDRRDAVAAPPARPARGPVRLVHLGLGNFFRAHQAWYTEPRPRRRPSGASPPSPAAAPQLAEALTAQDGLYTLITRAADRRPLRGGRPACRRAHPGTDHDGVGWATWPRRRCASVTITVTEAGYLRGADGGLDRDRAAGPGRRRGAARSDLGARCHRPGPAGRRPGRPARRRGGAADRRALRQPARQRRRGQPRWSRDLAELVDPSLADWMAGRLATSPPWSTGSRPRPPPTTCAARPAGRPGSTTAARSPPSRSASGCSAAPSPADGPPGRTRAPRFTDDIDPFEHAQAVAAQRRPLACWPTPVPSVGPRDGGRGASPTRPAAAGWRSGGRRRPRHLTLPRGRRGGLPGRAAGTGSPTRRMRHRLAPDRRRRLPEAAGPHPATLRLERAAGRLPRALSERWPPGSATCAVSASRSSTPAPTR